MPLTTIQYTTVNTLHLEAEDVERVKQLCEGNIMLIPAIKLLRDTYNLSLNEANCVRKAIMFDAGKDNNTEILCIVHSLNY